MGPFEQLWEYWYRLRGNYPVKIDEHIYRCDTRHMKFWQKVNRGKWEPETYRILASVLTPDSLYCDVGAWIGPTVLYAAKRCSRIYCLEPDPLAYGYLLENLRLNQLENVLPFHIGLAPKDGIYSMASPRGKLGDSMTSLLVEDTDSAREMACLSWLSWLELIGSPRFDCIKMDIEGAEFSLLPQMADYLASHTPALYLSLHPHLLPGKTRKEALARIVEVLTVYDNCYDAGMELYDMQLLMQGEAAEKAGSYLFLAAPEKAQ